MKHIANCEFCGGTINLDGGIICCVDQAVKLNRSFGIPEADIRARWRLRNAGISDHQFVSALGYSMTNTPSLKESRKQLEASLRAIDMEAERLRK